MLRRLAAFTAMLAAGLGPAPGARAATVPPQPYEMVRSLRNLQDQAAKGEQEAMPMLRVLLVRVGQEFADVDAEEWNEPRNQYAAVTYLLNGGNPEAVKAVLANAKAAPEMPALLKGAFAYADGDTPTMLKAFGAVKPERIPFDLLDSVYLVSAEPLAQSDPLAALGRLDYVRLTAPGSLLEEAAIRRSLNLAGKLGRSDELRRLARNYLGRFGASPFRRDFVGQLCSGIVLLRDRITDAEIAGIGDFAAPPMRLDFYLQLARSELLGGHAARARFAAQKAQDLAGTLGADPLQARLYGDIGAIATADAASAAARLMTIPRGELAPPDAGLLDAALIVAREITQRPEEQGAPVPTGELPAVEETTARRADQTAFATTVSEAKQALADVDRVLGGSGK